MSWSGRERSLFYITAGAVVLGLAWFVLIDPVLERYSALSKRETDYKVRESKLWKGRMARPGVVDEIHEIENQITASAPEAMETDFYADMDTLATRSGVSPITADTKRQPLRDGYEEIVLEIRLETDTGHLTDYLYWLENSPRRLRISRLDIARSSKVKPGEGALAVNMRLSTVVKSQTSAAGDQGGAEKKGEKR